MRKCGLFYILLLSLGFTSALRAQEVITIRQAIDKTLTNNLQIKQSVYNADLSDENLKQSKLALYPNLNSSIGQSMGWGRNNLGNTGVYQNTQNYQLSLGASAGIDLFNGFSKLNQIKQNKLLLDAGKASIDKIKNDLVLQVVTSYLQILYNKDFLNTANQQLEVARKQLIQEQQLLDVGNKTLADLSQAKSQVATAELNVTDADNALSISYLTLAQLMDIPSSTKYDVKAPLLSSFNVPATNLDAEAIYNDATGIFPDIKLARLQTEAAEKGVDVAKGGLYPRLSLSGSYGTGYFYDYNASPAFQNQVFNEQLKNNISKSLGMSLSIPIFNGLQARSGIRRAKINLLQTETEEQLTRNNLNKIIYQAVADLKAADSRYKSTTNTFLAQKDAFNVIDQRYNVGLVNSLDYSTAQTNLNKAEIDMIQAKYDLLFRAKVIDYYLGKEINF